MRLSKSPAILLDFPALPRRRLVVYTPRIQTELGTGVGRIESLCRKGVTLFGPGQTAFPTACSREFPRRNSSLHLHILG